MKKIFYSLILFAVMLLAVPANAQTSPLPLTSGEIFEAYSNYQKGIYAKAFETFKSLSDNGDAHATYGLGVCYYNGRGTTKNLEEAFKCFDRSYNRGIKSAAFIIGKCYFYGQGVGKNLNEAEKYLTEASNQGNLEAKTLLPKLLAAMGAVDLGLPSGTLWASCNVGANNPWEYGDYFSWGETSPKSVYDDENNKYNSGKSYTKYNPLVDNKTTLERSDDAATANWGSGWCMPTVEQFQELKDKCTWTWGTRNGKNGYVVKGSNGKTIFLPCAGYSLEPELSLGFYWSSSLWGECCGFQLFFSSDSVIAYSYDARFNGCSVRPVRRK